MAFSAIPANAAGLFQTLAEQQDRFEPQIIGFDTSVLALTVLDAPLLGPQTPAVIPPWQLPDRSNESPLARQAEAIAGLRSLIDRNARGVDSVGITPDARESFILFDALSKLETLARFASEGNPGASTRSRIDERFARGLEEIRSYLGSAAFETLTILPGEKAFQLKSPVELGSNSASFTGRSVATAGRGDPLPGINGDEVLTLSLTRNGTTTEITIDLAEIAGPVSINAFVDLVNVKIAAIPSLDGNGNPILDSNGDPVPLFTTRFSVVSDENFDHAIRIEGSLLEEVSLRPAVPEPALYVSSTLAAIVGDEPLTSEIRRFDDIAGTLVPTDRQTIAATDNSAPEESDAISPTSSRAIAVDSEGFIYTVGTTSGSFGNEINSTGATDVFLEKRDSEGNVLFTRLLGSARDSDAFSIAIDSADNVVVAGQTSDNLSPGARISGLDSFVAKYSPTGDLLFTTQIDSAAEDGAVSVAFDANDNILFTGFTRGAVDAANPGFGGRDTLVAKIDGTSGARLDLAVFGSAGDERGQAIALAADGNILIASRENGEAILRKLDINDLSNILLEQSLGTIGSSGSIDGLKISGNDILLAGTTSTPGFDGGATVANAASGGEDGFLLKLSDQGTGFSPAFISFIGTASTDRIDDIAIGGGRAYLAGSTRGDLTGNGKTGSSDGFVARIDLATGAIEAVQSFGQLLTESAATGIAFAENGPGVLEALGLPLGSFDRTEPRTIEGQTTAKAGDYFEISIDGGRRQRILLEAGDDFSDIARKINRLSLRPAIEASAILGGLTITALGSANIEFFAGEGSKDLLAKLGIEPQRILGETRLFEIDPNAGPERPSTRKPPKIGGVFALKLTGPLGLKDEAAARFTLARISEAIETVKRAFRSLTPSPIDSGTPAGRVPPQLSKELGNYTAALQRLAPEFFLGGNLV